jgi:hypothetical protein
MVDDQTAEDYNDALKQRKKGGHGILTLFIIGMVVLTVKLVALTLSVTWGLTKTILFGVGLPVILAVLFIAGLTAFAVPLLILALLGVFLLPLFGI